MDIGGETYVGVLLNPKLVFWREPFFWGLDGTTEDMVCTRRAGKRDRKKPRKQDGNNTRKKKEDKTELKKVREINRCPGLQLGLRPPPTPRRLSYTSRKQLSSYSFCSPSCFMSFIFIRHIHRLFRYSFSSHQYFHLFTLWSVFLMMFYVFYRFNDFSINFHHASCFHYFCITLSLFFSRYFLTTF